MSAGTVLEELLQGREDPLLSAAGISSSRATGAIPLPELWPALVNGRHDNFIVGAHAVSPLYASVLCGVDTQAARLEAYFAAGASVDAPAEDGTTALMVAFVTSQAATAELLLRHGASVDVLDSQLQPAAKYAAASVGRLPSWTPLVDVRRQPPSSEQHPLLVDDVNDPAVASCVTALQLQGK